MSFTVKKNPWEYKSFTLALLFYCNVYIFHKIIRIILNKITKPCNKLYKYTISCLNVCLIFSRTLHHYARRSSKDSNNVKNDWKIMILEQKSLYLNVATLEYHFKLWQLTYTALLHQHWKSLRGTRMWPIRILNSYEMLELWILQGFLFCTKTH